MKILVIVSMQDEFLYGTRRHDEERWNECIEECSDYIRNEIENGCVVVAVKDVSDMNQGSEYNKKILSALKTAQEDKRYSIEKEEFGATMLPPMLWDIITVWGVPDEIEFIGADCSKGLICTVLLVQSEFHNIDCSVNGMFCYDRTYELEDTAIEAMANADIKIR